MIPHILHIKNFLSYGPETQIIDFRPYNLISLSGKNGHGKSALLDAITWAIWGQARKSSGQTKPDAGLLHLGQKHMMVILEFEVNGNLYRIRREYLNAQSKPFATLDFGIQHADGKLVPLTDKTIKDTQDKIDRTIGITYDSFVNSTFLRQGQSNEFSKKSPKERKEILAQILQLQRFEQQKKIALAHARKQQLEWQAKTHVQERIAHEISQLSSEILQTTDIEQKITLLKNEMCQLEQAIEKNNHEQQNLKQQLHETAFLEKQIQEYNLQLQQVSQEIDTLRTQHQDVSKPISKETLIQQEQQLIETLNASQKHQQERNQLKELYLGTKEQLDKLINAIEQQDTQQRQNITTQISTTQETLKLLHKQITHEKNNTTQTEKNIAQTTQQHAKLMTVLQSYQQTKTVYEELKKTYESQRQQYQQICAQGTYSKQYLQKLEQDISAIKDNDQAACLMCHQSLDPKLQQTVHDQLNAQHQQHLQQLIDLKEQAHQLKADIAHNNTQLTAYQQQYEQYLQAQAQLEQQTAIAQQQQELYQTQHKNIQTLHQEESNLQQALQDLQTQCSQLDSLRIQNMTKPEIVTLQKNLQEIEIKAKSIPTIKPEEYSAREKELADVRKKLSHLNQLQSPAQQELLLSQALKQEQWLLLQINNLKTKLTQYGNIAHNVQTLESLFQQYQQQKQALQQQYQQALITQASLDQKAIKSKQLEQELSILVTQTKQLHQELVDYQEIARALGKDGIQALLIEQAIPEIEHETNLILSRLTNNQTQIFIESLRDLKKGGSRETLDIKISDPFGIRDYEMFSGGEAFRIDFALRIGISKLLARRAGTTLQTIFIDEGFGSQDEEGLGLIMDNIHKIQEDFAKIIVVSHLPEMKEQFPVQFIVEKRRSGSNISIIQQG